MVAGSILPITIHNNELYFLFGKENSMEDSAKGWSDFGGGCENNETPYNTALREGGEELSGFLGGEKEIKNLLRNGIYKLKHNTYHVHMFFYKYDENLPKYYNLNHSFLWKRMDNEILNKSKLFEKIEIKWFSIKEIKKNIKIFRKFYQEIVDKILLEEKKIYEFACKKSKNNRKTRKILANLP